MTPTPDYRIRADWTLPAETAAPPPTVAPDTSTTATPDTSTTAGKIAVMQHVAVGGQVQMMTRGRGASLDDDGWSESWTPPSNYNFNWERYDYRIAPPPVARTALQRARERTRAVLVDEATTGDVQLAMLVREIDVAPAVWFGSTLLDNCGIVGHAPGRYRLVRDDE